MLRYIIQRIFQLIPVLIGISLITFFLSFIIPGDPVRAIMGQRSDREAELRIRQKYGLDQPWYVQYYRWVRNLVRNPGQLPECRIKVEDADGIHVYNITFSRDMVFATDGILRDVGNSPYKDQLLTHIIEAGCTLPGGNPVRSGSRRTFIGIDTRENTSTLTFADIMGTVTEFNVSSELEVCTDAGGQTSDPIDRLVPGTDYICYFESVGFRSGRQFNAVLDVTETTFIDGMFDDSSTGASELTVLSHPEPQTIKTIEKVKSSWFITLETPDGVESRHELMPNALLMLGGNRAEPDQFSPGDEVMAAYTEQQETTIYALYDDESSGLESINSVLEFRPESLRVSGKLTDIYLTPAVWFDFGRSYAQHKEVRDIISESFVNTAYLTMVAMVIAILIGVSAGIISAVKPYSILDYLTMTAALIGVSMPVFWLGLMLILLVQGQLGWVSGTGYGEVKWFALNLGLFQLKFPWHEQVILPGITLATVPMAIIARMTRSSMLEVMNLDYIRTARAKGLNEWTVIIRHALKNSLIPIITVIGVNFAYLLAGAVLTETVFSWPGLGRAIVDAIEFRDFPVVMAGVVLFAFVFVMVNLVVDILYAYIDPRIRFQ